MPDFWNFVTQDSETTKETSLDDRLARVRAEINKQVNPTQQGATIPYQGSNEYWVYQLYEDYAILMKGQDYLKVSYSWDGESVVLGTMIPVEMCWMPKGQMADMATAGMAPDMMKEKKGKS